MSKVINQKKKYRRGMTKAVVSVLLCVALVLSGVVVAPMEPETVKADGQEAVNYIEYDDMEYRSELTCSDYTVVTSETTSWSAGWYVVKDNIRISDRINCTGVVHLILCDGASLTAEKGISVTEGTSLYIYGQTNNTGRLTARGTDNSAGIGGDSNNPEYGSVYIHGGIIRAYGGSGSAGIGGGYNSQSVGSVYFYRGVVTAIAGSGAPYGIGGGEGTQNKGILFRTSDMILYGDDENKLEGIPGDVYKISGNSVRKRHMKVLDPSTIADYYTVNFKVKNGSWNDGSKDDITIDMVRPKVNGLAADLALTLLATDIPAVGSMPASGYIGEGSWSPEAPTEKTVSSDLTYVYTYRRDPSGEVSPYIPPYTPPAPEPKFPGGQGWSGITNEIANTPEGGTVMVDMNGTTKLPGVVISSIQGKDVNIILDMGNGVKWTINGKDVTDATADINMAVTLNSTGIPVDVINNFTGERYTMQIQLAHEGAFGFSATLTVEMRQQDAGLFANLFRYIKNEPSTTPADKASVGTFLQKSLDTSVLTAKGDVPISSDEQGKLEFVSCGKIREDGSVDFEFNHASDYAVVVDDHSLDPSIKPETTYNLKLKASSKKKQVTLKWKKLDTAKKYRVYQYVSPIKKKVKGKTVTLKKGKYKLVKELKKNTLTVRKSLTQTKKKEGFKAKKKYTYAVRAYVDGKWTKIDKNSKVTVKMK